MPIADSPQLFLPTWTRANFLRCDFRLSLGNEIHWYSSGALHQRPLPLILWIVSLSSRYNVFAFLSISSLNACTETSENVRKEWSNKYWNNLSCQQIEILITIIWLYDFMIKSTIRIFYLTPPQTLSKERITGYLWKCLILNL